MTLSGLIARTRIDPYILLLIGTVCVAAVLPASGQGAVVVGNLANVAVGFLFFLYGARLSPQAAIAGFVHWRLHIVVLVATFVLFPALGLLGRVLVPSVLSPDLYVGLVYLCALPSTVQSSIAFTSIARGNVAAAICAASASNIIGILLTPLLISVLLGSHGVTVSAAAIEDIVIQLFLPFLAGQLLRPWIGGWVQKNKKVLGLFDRGSILLVVYTAFSEGVTHGIWHQLSVGSLVALLVVNLVLLALVLGLTTMGARLLGFNREDEITIVFCGSKKSLASGLPMASVLFAGQSVGLIVLPLMLFHQIQLMACAAIARRYGARPTEVQEERLVETASSA